MESNARSPSSDVTYIPPPVPHAFARPPPNVVARPALPSPISRPTPKPRKNEKSTIYANRDRGTNGKRRDPNESESGKEVSDDGESEMDWSGDDEPKRKRRKGNGPEMNAEWEALKAFNEVSAEVLTGTIGESYHSEA